MKKTISMLALAMVLLLTFTAAAGADVTLNETVESYGGQSTIRWTADSVPQGGFTVIVEALNPRGSASFLQLAGQTTEKSLTTGILAPDKSYKVYVVDSNFDILGTHEYTMPSVPLFEDGLLKNTSVKVTTELRQASSDGQYKRIKSFNATDMNALASDGTGFSCMKYQMQMPQLAYARNFYVQLVFEAPNGYTYTDMAQEVTFDRVNNGYQTVWWDYAGANFFDNLYRQTGSIPSGVYTIYLYWDGCFVNASTFNVN